jgi:hypothetical protein
MGADEFVKFAGRQNQQQSLAHGLRCFTFGTIKLARSEVAELLLHCG